jgi:dTDP-4-dehydrorhamnose 3,5-epimerase
MKIIETEISDVKIIVSDLFQDDRGFFMESYNEEKYAPIIGSDYQFVQDNLSRSVKNVLRGLHYQRQKPQGKLVRVVRGEIFDVCVDLRRSSPTFGKYFTCRLSDQNHQMLWVPPQFAHGFLVTSEIADVLYKTTDFYAPKDEHCLRWDDKDIAIPWPIDSAPSLSDKDRKGKSFNEADYFP